MKCVIIIYKVFKSICIGATWIINKLFEQGIFSSQHVLHDEKLNVEFIVILFVLNKIKILLDFKFFHFRVTCVVKQNIAFSMLMLLLLAVSLYVNLICLILLRLTQFSLQYTMFIMIVLDVNRVFCVMVYLMSLIVDTTNAACLHHKSIISLSF